MLQDPYNNETRELTGHGKLYAFGAIGFVLGAFVGGLLF